MDSKKLHSIRAQVIPYKVNFSNHSQFEAQEVENQIIVLERYMLMLQIAQIMFPSGLPLHFQIPYLICMD
jgi:hypothetical protein